jgi:TrmH family RNA methyltransferase
MLTKNEIKHISSLSIKKYREIHNEFTAEGVKVVAELLNSNYKIRKVFCIEEWYRKNEYILSSGNYEFEVITEKELERISSLSTPNQVIAVATIPENTQKLFDPEKELILALDDIKDPGNLGTIIRTADWFGIKKIICSESTVDVYNTKVIQAAMGSSFRVEILYTGLLEYLNKLNNKINIYGALLDGEIIYNQKLSNNGIIIIGNESKGISDEIKPFVTDKLFIPQVNTSSGNGKPESLNASIATAVICYEFCRQNQNK